jgi:hypothetical protein
VWRGLRRPAGRHYRVRLTALVRAFRHVDYSLRVAAPRLDRTIRFVAWEDLPNRPPFELERFGDVVEALDAGNWRLEDSDMTTAASVFRRGDPICFRYFRIRGAGDLPSRLNIERETLPLDLPEGESISDWIHVVRWPDGYAAYDPHRDAPTVSRLAWYARQRANQYVRFVNLYDRTLIDQLHDLDELTALDFRVVRSDPAQDAIDRRLGLLRGAFALHREAEAATVTTSVSVGRSRRRQLSEEIREDVLELAERSADLLDQLVVRGRRDGRSVQIDLLNQRIQRRVRVNRASPSVRAPAPETMFDEIIELRRQLDADRVLEMATRATAP